jgi:hypothetical protein
MTKKKQPTCPTCGGKMGPPTFELPEWSAFTYYCLDADDGEWESYDNFDNLDTAIACVAEPGVEGAWCVVYSNKEGKVVWGPEWVPEEDE